MSSSSSRGQRASRSRKRERDAASPRAPALLRIDGGSALPARVVKLWQQGEVCDATVVAQGREFPVHRCVLMAASEFFDGAFGSGLAESASTRVSLDSVEASALEPILEYVYTGECQVDEAALLTLLQGASFLRVGPLVAAIVARLEDRLTPDNCLDLWAFGEAHTLPALVEAARVAALRGFDAAAASAAFLHLPHARLLELLQDPRLEASREESVHEAVLAWAKAQRPAPDEEALLPLLRTVRYPLVARDFFEQTVMAEPLLHSGTLAIKLFGSAFVDVAFGPRIGRRPGFGPSRPQLTWSSTHKGDGIVLLDAGLLAIGGESEGEVVRSAEPLPATGKHLVEVVYEQGLASAATTNLGACYFTGVVSADVDTFREMDRDENLAHLAHGFWGIDDIGDGGETTGVRRGKGGEEGAPPAALVDLGTSQERGLFVRGDRLGLLVDMDERTLTFHRNGDPIPSLVLGGLPEEVYVVATPYNTGSRVRIVQSD